MAPPPGTADGASSITVAVRVRPFSVNEAAQLAKPDNGTLFLGDGSLAAAPAPKLGNKGIRSIVKVVDDRCLVFDPPEDAPVQKLSRMMPTGKRSKDQTFGFDKVFDEHTINAEVYEATTKGLLDSVLDGYNATVFAYGATGCGKTHTITGTDHQPGIILLTMQELFERIEDLQGERVTDISLSYLEIYNETIRDLLVPGHTKQGLMLREDAQQAVSVAGLSSHHPQNVEEVLEMVVRGNAARTQSPTDANATSSRSHAVLQINVAQKDRNAAISEPTTMATLSIIDLAGSERASATRNRGERLLEGANINKSLLALGSCINALCDTRKNNHIPYRNSKLTRLLKFSLGGNCKTVMIVCVSPSSVHFDETQNTLRYANRAKNIQTKVVRNIYNVDRHVKDYIKKIDEQMARINELQAQQKDHEAFAMLKFKKVEERKQMAAKEARMRIKAAYDHANVERQERMNDMRRLRHVEKRISLITAWLDGLDQVCETRDHEEPPRSLAALKQTAQGIVAELEGSRQHFHQRISKSNWDRGITTALQNGIKQLQEADADVNDKSPDVTALKQEVEILRNLADREAFLAILDQEKSGDSALVQVLLSAHFETIAIINQIMEMDEQDAVKAAKTVLTKLVNSCTEATSQIIRPDGGLQIIQAVPPTRAGTPKKRKPVHVIGPSPMKDRIKANLLNAPDFGDSLGVSQSPARPSPGRSSPMRRKFGGARRGIALVGSPKKRSPVKSNKRGVRWRDDTEDGKLADYQPTPEKLDSSSPVVLDEMPTESAIHIAMDDDSADSSPMPEPPQTSALDMHTVKPSRFDSGFLTKSSPGGPGTSTLALRTQGSPLQEIHTNTIANRSPLSQAHSSLDDSITSFSSSDDGGAKKSLTARSASVEADDPAAAWASDRVAAQHISAALKRSSSVGKAARHHRQRSVGGKTSGGDARSPKSASASPTQLPAEGMFTASHARRMVRGAEAAAANGGGGGAGQGGTSVLSPRLSAVMKGTVASGRRSILVSTSSTAAAAAGGDGARDRTIVPGASRGARVSAVGGRAVWR